MGHLMRRVGVVMEVVGTSTNGNGGNGGLF